MIDGVECAQLTFVGQIHNVNHQATNLVMTLDDGTGQVEARQWLESSSMDLDQIMEKQGIQENEWIRVMGTVKHFGGKRHFNAMVIRPVKDPHEIYFSLLEALQVHMLYTRGPPQGADQPMTDNSAPSAYSASAATSNVNSFGNMKPMERKILQHIMNSAPGEEGIHVSDLTRGLGPNINAEEVRYEVYIDDAYRAHWSVETSFSNALDSLTEAGHIYNTIDEYHYQVST
ncbi:replication factor A protein 2 [Tulasnella sp. 427]|nr:replication factor A protein 2 [Tulasnella sp. 427]